MSGNAVDSVLQKLKHQLVVGGDTRSTRSMHHGSEGADGQGNMPTWLHVGHAGLSKGYRREHKHIVRFLVMKMSWRGLYRRIMTVTRDVDNSVLLETYHPETGALTNSWPLTQDVVGLSIGGEHPHEGGIFMLTIRKGGGTKEVKFACQERAGLVEVLYSVMYRYVSVTGNVAFVPPSEVLNAYKISKKTQQWKKVLLRMSAIGLDQIDHRTKEVTWRWRFLHVSNPGIRLLGRGNTSCPPGHQVLALFSATGKSPRVFAFKNRQEFCSSVSSVAMKCMGIELEIDQTTERLDPEDLFTGLATAENEKALAAGEAPLSEWNVLKVKMKDDESLMSGKDHKVAPRRLILTRQSFMERHSDNYDICEWRSLSSIACLICYAQDPQWIGIEWGDGSERDVFITKEREALLTSLLYTAQQSAKRPIEVLPFTVGSGHPLIRMHYHPVGSPAIFHDTVTELISLHMLQDACNKFMQSGGTDLSLEALALAALEASPDCPLEKADDDHGIPTMVIGQLEERILEFNASVPYSGLARENIVEHYVVDTLLSLLPKPMMGYHSVGALTQDEERLVLMALHALQRVCTSNSAKSYILGLGGSFKKVYYCLGCNNDHVSVEAARLILRFFLGTNDARVLGEPSWSENFASDTDPIKRHEVLMASRMAKSVCFMTDSRCASIVEPLKSRAIVSPFLGSVIMEIVVSVACFPGAETTDMATRETMIVEVSSLGRTLFSLFSDARLPVYDGLALVMRTLAEGGSKAAEPMRQAALQEGAVLTHLRIAMSADRNDDDRITSRELVSLWCDGYKPAMELLKRIFPAGLTVYLDRNSRKTRNNGTRPDSGGNGYHSRNTSGGDMSAIYFAGKGHQLAFPFLQGDWSEFWSHVDQDYHHAGLIWNETCRSELRQSLKSEESMLKVGRQKMSEAHAQIPAWNAGDFSIRYSSLIPHIQVGNVYIKLLVESNDKTVLEHIRDPKGFISSAYVAFLRLDDSFRSQDIQHSTSRQESQCLCLKAMSMVYCRYTSIIGPFEELTHILRIMDSTGNRKMRYYCLELIHSFICPNHVEEDEEIRRIAKENAMRLSQHDGIPLLCDAAATIHEVVSSSTGSKDTKLITSAFQDIEPKLWFYADYDLLDHVSPENKDDLIQTFNMRKQGPVTKREIRSLYRDGSIRNNTYVSRIGMKCPAALESIRELRWWCAQGVAPFSERDFSLTALDVLTGIFQLCPAKDPISGIQLLPLPVCHRQMSKKNCVSRIAQTLLTNDPEFFNKSCKLLSVYISQNSAAMKTIYQTGIFFYILAYSGSDLIEAGKFLRLSHLQQKFMQSEGLSATCSLSQNSILGDLLPESLLFILESYGHEAFSTAMTGNSESPEIIWTHEMRQKLIPHLWNHIGDFARLLKESWSISYDYYPCPPIVYEEIQDEIWCHRYYLRHLCNTSQYPNWNIVDHVELLQAILGAWKTELAKVGVQGMSLAEAAKVLELDPSSSIDESEMKKAYRRLAKKYHPDRNPAGREHFQLVHDAYVRLHSAREEIVGPRDWCILLYLKAQCLLYSGYPESLAEFKYAGYPYLIASLSLSNEIDSEDYGQILSGKFIPILQSSLHLCWLTCEVSELNAEELMRSDGIRVLESIFSRCVSITSRDAPLSDPQISIMVDILKTFGAMAKFESARLDLEERHQLMKDVIRCCEFTRATNVVSSSLHFIGEMTNSVRARTTMIQEKAVTTLIPLLFGYDCAITLDKKASEDGSDKNYEYLGNTPNKVVNSQQELHQISLLACEVFAKLFSQAEAPDDETDVIDMGRRAFRALFTPPVAQYISSSHKFLGYINNPVQDHTVIWTEGMKSQLDETLQSLEEKESHACLVAAADIHYANLVGETYISGVYIRLFCERPSKGGFQDVEFCKDLVKVLHTLEHLGTSDSYTITSATDSLERPGNKIEPKKDESRESMISRNIILCLRSLKSLLMLSPKLLGLLSTVASIEPIASVLLQGCLFCGPDPSLGEFPGINDTAHSAFIQPCDMVTATEVSIAVFLTLSSNAKCLTAIAQPNIPLMLSFLIDAPPNMRVLKDACECLFNMAEKDAFSSFVTEGGLLYLLKFALRDVPEGFEATEVSHLLELKQMCLHSVIKAASNGLHGQKVIILLERLLPKGLVAQLMDNEINAAYEALTSSRKTPEVIWNPGMLHDLQGTLVDLCQQARLDQQSSLKLGSTKKASGWSIPKEFMIRYDALEGHTEVDGVFIDLLLQNPAYPIRNPRSLLNASLKLFIDESQDLQHEEELALPNSALVDVILLLLSTHPSLADDAVSSGHLTTIFTLMKDISLQKSARAVKYLRIAHAISVSSMSSEAMARAHPPVLHTLMKALEGSESTMQILSLEIIKRAMGPTQKARDILIRSGLDLDLLPALLNILNWKESDSMDKSDAINMMRFLCVEIIRLMELEGPNQGAVKSVVAASPIWAAYRDQRHDMFLPSGANQSNSLIGMLEGSQPYMLAAGESNNTEEEVLGDDLIQEVMKQAAENTRKDEDTEDTRTS